jgi:hypothetical protein
LLPSQSGSELGRMTSWLSRRASLSVSSQLHNPRPTQTTATNGNFGPWPTARILNKNPVTISYSKCDVTAEFIHTGVLPYQTFTHNIASARGNKKKGGEEVILHFSTAAVSELTVTHGNQYLRLPSLWPSSIIASPSCSIRKSSYTSARLKSDHFHIVMYSNKEFYACFKCEHKPMSTGMHG